MLWFADADVLVQRPDEVPIDAARAGKALGLTELSTYAQIVDHWGRVDLEARARVGAAGELALVDLLNNSAVGRVEHVAALSDGFGFDIAIEIGGKPAAHLEVKSTTRRGRMTFYLSRHEFDTMLRDPYWQLVILRLHPETLRIEHLSTVDLGWITEQVPVDAGSSGSWQSCRLDVPAAQMKPGIEILNASASAPSPAFIRSNPP